MDTTKIDKAPWETYGDSLSEKLDPKLEQEIAEYSKKHHNETSSQNEEELARWKEQNDQLARQYQFLTPEEYANEPERIGKITHSSLFINKLNKLGINCWYREHPHKDKLTLIVDRNGGTEVACWVPNGFMPEYSIVRFDDHGVPLNEKYRGWRTCLLQLILKKIISEEKAHEVFGKASGPAAERYNRTLYSVRNTYVKAV